MEEEKCLKYYWSKIILITGIAFILTACMYINRKSKEQHAKENGNEPYKALSVKYQDSIYRMVLRSNDIVLKMKYPDEFLRTLKDSGVLNIDSATFYELRKDIVTPQPLIDSIFKGNVDTLLSHFFDDNGFIAFEFLWIQHVAIRCAVSAGGMYRIFRVSDLAQGSVLSDREKDYH